MAVRSLPMSPLRWPRRSAGLLLAACSAPPAPPPAFPPADVTVVVAAPRSVPEVLEFAGTVEAFRSVEIRSEVTGVILDYPYTEGAQVRAGDVLFRLDSTAYEATARGARARLADAEARRLNAGQLVERLRPLLADNAVARRDVEVAEAQLAQAEAAVEDARAAVDRAQKDLRETVVRAPIDGRAGRANLVIGARVSGPGDLLTTIDVLDPVHVSFHPSAQDIQRWRRDAASDRALRPGGAARVEVVLSDGRTAPTAGRIDFFDPVVDPATGTQRLRAVLRNAEYLLLPGQFVRVRLTGLVRDNAIVVPQRAVIQAMGRQMVYVVGPGDTVEARPVTASGWSGGNWLIDQGLAAGDRVIVDGIQKTGPGATVRPTVVPDSTAGGAAPAGPQGDR